MQGPDATKRDPRALPALLATLSASAVFIWLVSDRTEFFGDEWHWIYGRLRFDLPLLIQTHNGNLVAAPLLLYQGVIGVFGLEAYWPFRVLTIVFTLLCSLLLFLYLRRRTSEWIAFVPAALLPVFGAAFWIQTTSLGLVWTISISAGLGALLALDRRDRTGDLAALALLVVSVCSLSTGAAFIVAAAVAVSLRPGSPPWRGWWIWLTPAALYLAWLVWARVDNNGIEDPSTAELANVTSLPEVIVDSIAAVLTGLAGFQPEDPPQLIVYLGTALALAGVAAFCVGVWRVDRNRKDVLTWVGLALSYWLSITLVAVDSPVRSPIDSRYLWLGGIAIAAIACLLSPPALSRRAGAAVAVVTVVALGLNMRLLADRAEILETSSRATMAYLSALDLANGHVDPLYVPRNPAPERIAFGALYPPYTVDSYLIAASDHGSPAMTEQELRDADELQRLAVDRALAQATGLRVVPAGGRPPQGARECAAFSRGGELAVPSGSVLWMQGDARESVELQAHRYSDRPVIELGYVPAGARATLTLPPDPAEQPWSVTLRPPSLAGCLVAS